MDITGKGRFAMTRHRLLHVLCGQCGGHLGHMLDDGPKPSGLRDSMNGVALTFRGA
jgi:peptide-methionine (R)-S-oxide reductase